MEESIIYSKLIEQNIEGSSSLDTRGASGSCSPRVIGRRSYRPLTTLPSIVSIITSVFIDKRVLLEEAGIGDDIDIAACWVADSVIYPSRTHISPASRIRRPQHP